MENQAVEVVGDVRERQFGLGAGASDRADEQPEAVLLVGEDVLDGGADRRLLRIRPRHVLGHRLAYGLSAVNAADHEALREPGLVLPAPVGAVRPDLRAGVLPAHQVLELPPVGGRGRGNGALADEAVPAVDRDVRFVPEHRHRDLRQGRPVRAIADLTADLQRPAGVGVLLGRLIGLIGPDILGRLAVLDRRLLGLGVALFGRRHERGIDDLPGHGDVPLLLKLPVERLHHPLERARLGQPIAEVTDGVLIGRWRAEIETEKPHPGQPVADHELHPRVGEVVLRLQDQRLEHRHRIERRPTTLGAVAIAETFDQPGPEMLEINRRIEHLERIAILAQPLQMLREPEQARLPHSDPS